MERAFGTDMLIPAAAIAFGLLELVATLAYFSIRERNRRQLEERQRMQGQFPQRHPVEVARQTRLKYAMLLSACVTISAGIILGVVFRTI
ncbi:MAG TPA: hypothetical protein VGE07_18010 [Herpetosiphonaceae bacterium]